MDVLTIPCFADNFSYLVVCTDTREAAVVDPSDAAPVEEAVSRRGAVLKAVFNTHHHLDHVAGVEELARRHPGLRVFGHRSDRGRIPCQNEFLEDGDSVSVGRVGGRAMHTPGHTSGGVAYLLEDALFTGDTLFACGCGRLLEGTAEEMFRSLHDRIGSVPPSTRIFFGHEYTEQNLSFAMTVEPGNRALQDRVRSVGETRRSGGHTTPTTLSLERETNPFLRCRSPEILALAEARDPGNDLAPVSVFRFLRALKDRF